MIPDPFTTGVLTIALPHAPVIDGTLITAQVLDLVGQGLVNPNIPVIIGSNADESGMCGAFFKVPYDDDDDDDADKALQSFLFTNSWLASP